MTDTKPAAYFDASWALTTPIDAVVFDCDGTLSTVEGIDVLATMNGVKQQVETLTQEAMNEGTLSEALYAKRLALAQPTREQVQRLASLYYAQRVDGLDEVIEVLRALNKTLFVVSAGVTPAVAGFMQHYGFTPADCLAVDIYFDAQGHYTDFKRDCPMVEACGKAEVAQQLQNQYPRIAHIGDGMNDYSAHDYVTRFVGFGGVFYREGLKQRCQYYLETPTLLGLLPLVITKDEYAQLSAKQMAYVDKGVDYLPQQLKGEI